MRKQEKSLFQSKVWERSFQHPKIENIIILARLSFREDFCCFKSLCFLADEGKRVESEFSARENFHAQINTKALQNSASSGFCVSASEESTKEGGGWWNLCEVEAAVELVHLLLLRPIQFKFTPIASSCWVEQCGAALRLRNGMKKTRVASVWVEKIELIRINRISMIFLIIEYALNSTRICEENVEVCIANFFPETFRNLSI